MSTTRSTATQTRRKAKPSTRSTPAAVKPLAKTISTFCLFAGELQNGETNAAVQACNDYLLLGAGRSLVRLAFIYRMWDDAPQSGQMRPGVTKSDQKRSKIGVGEAGVGVDDSMARADGSDIPTVDELYPRPVNHYRLQQKNASGPLLYTHRIKAQPPTLSIGVLKRWSTNFAWNERAMEFDAAMRVVQLAEHKRVMSEGMALAYNRVSVLKKLFEALIVEVFTEDEHGNMKNLWVRDIKTIGRGDTCETVTVVRYNSALVNDVSRVLDDIAKEVGGRQSTLDALVRDLPWHRLPERFGRRMITENPKEVLYSMIEELCEQNPIPKFDAARDGGGADATGRAD